MAVVQIERVNLQMHNTQNRAWHIYLNVRSDYFFLVRWEVKKELKKWVL